MTWPCWLQNHCVWSLANNLQTTALTKIEHKNYLLPSSEACARDGLSSSRSKLSSCKSASFELDIIGCQPPSYVPANNQTTNKSFCQIKAVLILNAAFIKRASAVQKKQLQTKNLTQTSTFLNKQQRKHRYIH